MNPPMSLQKPQEVVVQSNRLVEAYHRLHLQEKRLVLWLIKLIEKDDVDFKKYKLNIIEFATLMGLNPKTQYKEMKGITKSLVTRAIEIEDLENESIKQIPWFFFAHWEPKKGICSLEFHPELKPYLLQLKEQLTPIGFADFLGLSSVYSVRIFELLSQYLSIGKRTTPMAELRAWCGMGKDEYERYNNFKNRAIEYAKTEINAKTEYEIDYTEIKESRKVVAIAWTIQKTIPKADAIPQELQPKAVVLERLIEHGLTQQGSHRLIKVLKIPTKPLF